MKNVDNSKLKAAYNYLNPNYMRLQNIVIVIIFYPQAEICQGM